MAGLSPGPQSILYLDSATQVLCAVEGMQAASTLTVAGGSVSARSQTQGLDAGFCLMPSARERPLSAVYVGFPMMISSLGSLEEFC